MGINDPKHGFTQWAVAQRAEQERIQQQRNLYNQTLQGSQLFNNQQAGYWNQPGMQPNPRPFTQPDIEEAMRRMYGQAPQQDPNVIDLPPDAVRVVEDVPLIEDKTGESDGIL